MSRMRALRIFNASMDFQSRTAKRIRLASIETTPEYIYVLVRCQVFMFTLSRSSTYLEFRLAAQQRYGKVVHGVRLESVVIPVSSLHDVIVRQPLHGCIGVFVDRGRVKGNRLVVGNVPPAFALAGQELGVEAPSNNCIDNSVVAAVDIVLFRNGKKLTLTTAVSSSACMLALRSRYKGSAGKA